MLDRYQVHTDDMAIKPDEYPALVIVGQRRDGEMVTVAYRLALIPHLMTFMARVQTPTQIEIVVKTAQGETYQVNRGEAA